MALTIGDILDQAQEFLHDDGAIWPRDELLDWANDGYRQLLAQSHAVVRPYQIDVPGRTAWAATQEWEDRHGEGTFRVFTKSLRSASISATFQWEAQALEGISPTASTDNMTNLWELSYIDSFDGHVRLVLSKQHERPLKVYHGDERLIGSSVREQDQLETAWWQQTGDPIFWFPSDSGGRDGTYEVYEIDSEYSQGYHIDSPDGLGMPRLFTGSRTYAVDTPFNRWDYAYSGSPDAGMVPGLGFRFTPSSPESGTYVVFGWEGESDYDGDDADPVSTMPDPKDSDVDEVFLALGVTREFISPDRQYTVAPYTNANYATLGIPRDFKTSEGAITVWEIITSATQLNEDDNLSLIPQRMAKYLKFYVLSRAFSRKGRGFRPDLSIHFTSWFQIGVALLSRIGNLGFIDRNYARQDLMPQGYREPLAQLPPEFERF